MRRLSIVALIVALFALGGLYYGLVYRPIGALQVPTIPPTGESAEVGAAPTTTSETAWVLPARRNDDSNVSFIVSPLNLSESPKLPLEFQVLFYSPQENPAFDFAAAGFLKDDQGREFPAQSWEELETGQDYRVGTLTFAPIDPLTGTLTLVLRGVADTPERNFQWNLAQDTQITLNLATQYELPAAFGDLGPRLVKAGVIDLNKLYQLYRQNGVSMPPDQEALLQQASGSPIILNQENANFWLNMFWAVGLANRNPILSSGAITKDPESAMNFASTGGWTLGNKAPLFLFNSLDLIPLTPEQQARLEEAAHAVYRPCCNNPTDFPDCNHGMAMLGLLELMASQNAGVEEMRAVAKAANEFWFPQQSAVAALYFKYGQGVDWERVNPNLVVGEQVSSQAGFQQINQWVSERHLLHNLPGGGSGC